VGTEKDVYRRQLLISSIYRVKKWNLKLTLFAPILRLETATFFRAHLTSTNSVTDIGSKLFSVPQSDPSFKSKKSYKKMAKNSIPLPLKRKKNQSKFLFWIFEVLWLEREQIFVLTIGCCPLSSRITPNLEFRIRAPESSGHMIELCSWSLYFFSAGVFVSLVFFPSNIHLSVNIRGTSVSAAGMKHACVLSSYF